jgi:hypothetical protein
VTILHRNAGGGDAIGGGRWIGARSFEKSVHLFVDSPGKQAFLSTIKMHLSPQISFAQKAPAFITD